jgi:transcriptional regulator GlxA family with amidase domain
MRAMPPKLGFRLGIYVFKDVEVIDFAAPYGVFAVARRIEPSLDAFLIAESLRPVQAQAGFTVLPNYGFTDHPAMDAFLIPESTLLASVCTGSWIYGHMGLLDGLPATNRKEPDPVEASSRGMVPIDRLALIAPRCRISRARLVDAGRIVTAGGIASGMEIGFYLLERAGYPPEFLGEVARIMEYGAAYDLHRNDRLIEP